MARTEYCSSRNGCAGARHLALALAVCGLGMTAARAAETPSEAGVWTVSLDNANRQCRIQLRTDKMAAGYALAMPPGCRRALPVLTNVSSWSEPGGGSIAFADATGQAVLVFAAQGNGTLSAVAPDGDLIRLTPLGGRRQAAAPSAGAPEPVAVPVPAKPKPAMMTTLDVSGRYAVMRGDRDTGCMVTLESTERGPKATLKARLAPACRDQGIVIFDPIGWQLQAGHLVLTARKGHTTALDKDETGVWVKDPKDGKPIGLKRL